jgi:hypothetical protein
MSWRNARSLTTLLEQVNKAHPKRSKASDGTIGDAAHARTASDHNPDAAGIVRALDLTTDTSGDAASRLDTQALANSLVASHDPRIAYVICNRRIARGYPKAGTKAFTWAPYTGTDPHTSHVHISVVGGQLGDSTRPWTIEAKALPPKFPGLARLGARGTAVKAWQAALNKTRKAGLKVDGEFGPRTLTAVRNAQRAGRLPVDGVAGPATWASLYR